MIVSMPKTWAEIASYLEGEDRVFILGCNGCAQASGTGGPAEVAGMKERLEAAGKTVTGTMVSIVTNLITLVTTLFILLSGVAADLVEHHNLASVHPTGTAGGPRVAPHRSQEHGIQRRDERHDE